MLVETLRGGEDGGVLVVDAEEFVDLFAAAIPCCTLQARAGHNQGSLAGSISGADLAVKLREMGHFEKPEPALIPDRFAEREIILTGDAGFETV